MQSLTSFYETNKRHTKDRFRDYDLLHIQLYFRIFLLKKKTKMASFIEDSLMVCFQIVAQLRAA